MTKRSGKNPGDDPRAAQQEAKDLKPNQDTEEERDDILGREFEAENEHDLESKERQHRPLTDPEDNAEVDRVAESPRPAVVRQPEARPYLVSPAALRNIFVGSSVAGVAVIVGLLTLASSGNDARYTPADETQYQRTLQEATETITATGVGEDGTARIPIEEAIAVVAAQGLEPINTALAAPPAQAEPAPEQTAEQPTPTAEQSEQPGQDEASEAGQDQAEAPAQAQMKQEQTGQEQASQEQTDSEPADQQQADAPAQTAAGVPAATEVVDTAAGQAIYEANCASCHQATGAGVPGAFPPLAGHVPALYNADRSYLVNLLLYGLQGEIQVLGEPYNGAMPAWSQLSDDDIAATLNYVSTAWDNEGTLEDFQPFGADEIAPARDAALSTDEVYALRQELGLSADE